MFPNVWKRSAPSTASLASRITSRIRIVKTDAQNGAALAGAVFSVTDANGSIAATLTTGADGTASTDWLPYGTYTVTETAAPDHYINGDFSTTVNAHEDGKTYSFDVSNEPMRGGIRLVKTDALDVRPLSGVVFDIYQQDMLIGSMTTDEQGVASYGDWIIRETEAPEGYSRMEDYLLHVDENWTEPKPITLINIPDTYAFFKSDNKKNALAGAVFAVEDEQGNVVQEVVSAENGVVFIDGLTPGTYIIREIEAPEGFTCSDDTLKVVINEKYTHPAKLKRFVNYPSISTGVDITPTTLTWIGIGLAGMAAVIVIANMKVRKKVKKARR